MLSPARFAATGPANTQYHLRLQVRVSRFLVPYVRPSVKLTTKNGARL
ncbi:MAG: hypothetical protein Q7T55_08840 [Solirubrobacteraceae bacterium]|nr:hypothetical protein [Solirubrobacteraceae bacterium]